MFFRIDEKTIGDILKKQKEREAKRGFTQPEDFVDYDGHKLTFGVDGQGHTVILSDPPLVTVIEETKKEPDVTEQPIKQNAVEPIESSVLPGEKLNQA